MKKCLPDFPAMLPHARTRFSLLAGLVVLSTGCGEQALKNWRYDNLSTRKLQAASIVGLPERPIAGKTFSEFFKDKVVLIGAPGVPVPLGRGAPVAEDGYVLTAWHVVDRGSFLWSDTVLLKPLPKKSGPFKSSDYFRETKYPGRVVWHDEDVDLAIVKFDHRPSAILKAAKSPVERGTAVFSGAAGLNGGVLVGNSLDEGIGNGPFKTAGRVTKVRKDDGAIRRFIYQSTLVARGGMSGSGVVDEKGRLVGIVTRIHARVFTPPATSFTMIDPESLERIIRQDRVSHR
ncbi:MAG: serine protease [Verrucomicrobiaceae bacterium]|nr:MAG: serine protease [Verrucomicrobiaceae bacterium]